MKQLSASELTRDRVLSLLRQEQKLEVAVESHGDRRVQVELDRVLSDQFSG